MANDWIKWVKGLTSRREVVAIATSLGISRREVAAACMELWEWADDNCSFDLSRNGHAPSVTKTFIDDHVHIDGFAESLCRVGWLDSSGIDGLIFPNLGRHNGKSAKERALALDRQDRRRAESLKPVTEMSRCERDKNVTREEKRQITDTPPTPQGGDGSSPGRCIDDELSAIGIGSTKKLEITARWSSIPNATAKIGSLIRQWTSEGKRTARIVTMLLSEGARITGQMESLRLANEARAREDEEARNKVAQIQAEKRDRDSMLNRLLPDQLEALKERTLDAQNSFVRSAVANEDPTENDWLRSLMAAQLKAEGGL